MPSQTRKRFITLCGRADGAVTDTNEEPSVLPSLAARARQDPDPKIRSMVLDLLGLHSKSDEVVGPILGYLHDDDDDVRHWAILVLAFPAGDSDLAMDELIELLASDNPRTRGYASTSIGRAARKRDDSTRFCALLAEAFAREVDLEARCSILKGLGMASCSADTIRPVVMDALGSGSNRLLRATFFMLYEADLPELHSLAMPELLASLKTEDGDLRSDACLLLRRIKPSLLGPFTVELEELRNSPDHEVSELAMEKLRSIQGSALPSEE